MKHGTEFAAAVLALLAPAVFACGYCVEDKVAAVYDHAVIVKALERRHEVVFFAIEGAAAGEDVRRTVQAFLERSHGVDRGTVRVSSPSGSLSFAYDPARRRLGAIMRSLDGRVAAKGWTVSLLRVINEADRRPGAAGSL